MKTEKTQVKRMKIQKLTPNDLVKITGGCNDTRDCKGPGQPTCIAYIVTGGGDGDGTGPLNPTP